MHRAAALVAVLLGACGSPQSPSFPIAGDWEGRVAPFHFDYLDIRFSGPGEGVACYLAGDAPPDLRVRFQDVAVQVAYPNVFLRAPSGFVFNGHFQPDGTLVGESNFAGGQPYPMTLTRGGNYCGTGDGSGG